jgi:flagellar assembly protein FliH
MSSSSDTFAPLLTELVPAPHRVHRPALPPAPAAATAEAVPLRFVPLVEADDETAALASQEQARAAGFAAGFAAGSRRAAASAAAEAQAVRRSAAEAEAARSAEHDHALQVLAAATKAVAARELPVLDAAERRVHDAAMELATAILGVELSDAPTSARAAVTRAKAVDLPGDVVVRLSPRDAAVLSDPPAGLRVVVDPGLVDGDAVAEHADGELDARITSALARARAVLTEAAR